MNVGKTSSFVGLPFADLRKPISEISTEQPVSGSLEVSRQTSTALMVTVSATP